MAHTHRMLLLVCTYLSAALIGHTLGQCLQDGRHKTKPSPEPHLEECRLYSDNSCCSEQHIKDLLAPPNNRSPPLLAPPNNRSPHLLAPPNNRSPPLLAPPNNRSPPQETCGPLSPGCEGFLKRVRCFLRCSPDAARWPHPQHRTSLLAVPLCHSFCRDWFEACRDDLTCARNWAGDSGEQQCSGACIPYQQMYQHGRDLCEGILGDAFVTVEDEEERAGPGEERAGPAEEGAGPGRQPCGCLTLSTADREVMAALSAEEEQDTTKRGLPHVRAPCSPTLPPQARRSNAALRRRSLQPDMEGSGSGM